VPFVGLKGGIGAGKSEALAALERLGAATLSTDDVVHELLTSDGVRDELVARWGDDVAPEGRVDRDAVARVVFDAPEERRWLEGVLWPRVGARVAEWRQELESRDPPPPAAVVEVPLLFEAGMEGVFDRTLAVVADEDVRVRRAAERGHEGLEGRTSAQLTQEEKSQRADFTIHNNGSLSELEEKLSELLNSL
jgi:dephospho-CoA kinase